MRGQRPNSANQLVRESITEALFLLMEKQLFEKITVSDIVNKAGVGRASFYRNYINKEDVIRDYLFEYATLYWETNFSQEDVRSLWLLVFRALMSIGNRLILIEKGGLSWMFYPTILEITRGARDQMQLELDEAYASAAFSGMVTGLLTQWLQNGRQETAEQLVDMFMRIKFN